MPLRHYRGALHALLIVLGPAVCQTSLAVEICKDQAEDGSVRYVQCQLLDAKSAAQSERIYQQQAEPTPLLAAPYRPHFFDFSISPPAGFEYQRLRNVFTRSGTDLKLHVMEIPQGYERSAEELSRGQDHSSISIDGRQARLIRTLHRAPADSGYPDFRELKLLVGDRNRTVILTAVAPEQDRSSQAAYMASFRSLKFDD